MHVGCRDLDEDRQIDLMAPVYPCDFFPAYFWRVAAGTPGGE